MYKSIPLYIVNTLHMKSVFFSNSRDGRTVAINTFMAQLYQRADITFVLLLEKNNHDCKCDVQQFYECKVN